MRCLGFVFGGIGLLLSGCVTLATDPDIVGSVDYEIGYADGCATGQMRQEAFSRKVQRDDKRYEGEEAYRIGWNDGFNSCGGKGGSQDPYADSLDRWMSGGPHK